MENYLAKNVTLVANAMGNTVVGGGDNARANYLIVSKNQLDCKTVQSLLSLQPISENRLKHSLILLSLLMLPRAEEFVLLIFLIFGMFKILLMFAEYIEPSEKIALHRDQQLVTVS